MGGACAWASDALKMSDRENDCFHWFFRSLIDVRPALRTLLRLMSSARRAVVDAKSDAAGDGSCEEDVDTTTVRRRTSKAKCIIIRARMLGMSIDRMLVDTSRHFGINCPIRMAASNIWRGRSDPRKLTGSHRGDDFDGITDGQKKPIDCLFSPIAGPSRARWDRDGRMSRGTM